MLKVAILHFYCFIKATFAELRKSSGSHSFGTLMSLPATDDDSCN